VFTALTSAEGVVRAHQRGLLRRIAAELGDLQRARAQQRDTEAATAAALASLGLARLGDIPGLTVTGAAAISAESGAPTGTARHHRWPGMLGCPRPGTPRAPSMARLISPAAAGPACA